MPDDTSVLRDPSLWILFAVTTVGVGNVSSVSPAFPRLMDVFGVGEVAVGWIVTAYSLPGVLSAPLVGALADRVGRKRVLGTSLVLFAIAGTACALARDFSVLLALRVAQGACAAPLVALSITLIGDRYDGTRRAAAIGYNATALSIATATYPVVGGALAEIAWFWPFALPLLAVPVAGTLLVGLREPPTRTARSLRRYLEAAWEGVGQPRVAGLLLLNTGVFILLFGALLTYVPVLVDQRLAAAPFIAGVALATASAATAVMGTQVGRLAARFSLQALVAVSFGLYAIAFAGIALAPSVWTLLLATFTFGTAQGLNQPAIQTALIERSPATSRAVTLSLNGTALRVGQSVGPPIMGAALVLGGLPAVFVLASGLALVFGGAFFIFARGAK